MKTRLLILLLFAAFIGNAQKFEIPVQYEQAYKQNKKEQKKLGKNFDFVLDPIEITPMMPQSYEAGVAYNWGNRTLGIDRRYDDILERAKRKVAVFIFDTGGDWDHPYLSLWKGQGATFTGESESIDKNGHSTHVAGIIGGYNDKQKDQQIGLARALVEKDLVIGMPYKVLTNDGGGLYSWMAAAVSKANQEARKLQEGGYFVIYNFSLGGGKSYSAFDKVLSEALKMGVLIFSASGNSGKKGVIYPANNESTVAVAATDIENKKASFSTWGEEVEFGAPGVGIASTFLDNTIRSLSGTSMATPGQSALAAIVASIYPHANAEEVLAHLRKHAVDLPPNGKDDETGYGLSIIDRLLDNPIEDFEEEPEGEEPIEAPTRERRSFEVEFEQPIEVVWKASNEGKFKAFTIRPIIRISTNHYTDHAVDQLLKDVKEHFDRRYYVIPKNDFLDAAFWAGYFFDRQFAKGKNYTARIDRIEATDKYGYSATPPKKGYFQRIGQKRQVQSMQY